MSTSAALLAEAGQLVAINSFDFAERIKGLVRALEIYRKAGDEHGECVALTKLGNIGSNMADFVAALDYLHQAEAIADRLGDEDLRRQVAGHLAFVLVELGENDAALALAMKGWDRDSRSPDPEVRLFAVNALGCLLSASDRHAEAVARLQEADAIIASIAEGNRHEHLASQSLADLSDAFMRWGKASEALAKAESGAARAAGIGHRPLVMLNRFYAGRAALAMDDARLAAERLEEAAAMAAEMGHKSQESQARIMLAQALESLGSPAKALTSYREGHRLEREIRRDSAGRRLEFRRSQREIESLNRERESAERVLFAVLPPAIARRMKQGEGHIADDLADVSILFADLVGFTALSTRTQARELLDLLDRVFSAFDQLTESFGLEKVKTIGDQYMAVGGALSVTPDHVDRCARLGFEMIAAMDRLAAEGAPRLSIRIGLHAGPAIAGVIGRHRLSYDLWGDTVNLASRLESSGVPGRIHVSEQVAERLKGSFRLEPRGSVTMKGIGEMRTFLLGATYPLPVD